MNVIEFSNEFDTLVNSYSLINQMGIENATISLEFDEYEKSVFLTQAEELIIIELYSGKNLFRDSFERTEEIRRYLSDLIKTYVTSDKLVGHVGLSKTSMFFQIPEDVWFITYESAVLDDPRLGCLNGGDAVIIPITQDEYYRISDNPFRGASKTRVLRLDNADDIIELITDYNIKTYLVRYVKRPQPIILTDLHDNLSINGISVKTECELNPVLHRPILERATRLAIISRVPNAGKN